MAECTQETFDATRQTIEGQQEAFATGDFATARTFSSQSFQSYVSVEQFQEIIVGTYPFLIDSPELAFPECQRETDTVLMRVEVDGSPSVIMIYRLVLEDDGWFIDGASIAEPAKTLMSEAIQPRCAGLRRLGLQRYSIARCA